MYQRVVIVGHLGRDPEMRYTAGGAPVVNFPVATNRRWTDNEGNAQEETTWFRVSVWGRQAETCNQYLEKGRLVLVDGDIRTSQYDDQQGITRYSWELRAANVKFLGGPGERAAVPGYDGEVGASGGQAAPSMAGSMSEDDIPF
jgi:single-strand DNA-binding protein